MTNSQYPMWVGKGYWILVIGHLLFMELSASANACMHWRRAVATA
jgi:hypothetical protein